MNTFFTVWFLINGIWYANYIDGWVAYDRKSEEACQQSIEFSKDPTNRFDTKSLQHFTCEKDNKPKQKKNF